MSGQRAGRFITFEGGEGAGKSTQMARLAARLEARDISVTLTREPGGSPRAEAIRDFVLAGKAKAHGAFAEALLFSAARADHLNHTIRPALAEGRWVLCDRFADSTRVYQGMAGDVPEAVLTALETTVVGATRPDLTLVLDIPATIGLARAAFRRGSEGADRFEGESLAFHERLREGFRRIAADEPERCALIDASRVPGDVEEAVWRVVRSVFSLPEPAAAEAPHDA